MYQISNGVQATLHNSHNAVLTKLMAPEPPPLVLGYLHRPYKLYKADSGAIRFRFQTIGAVPRFCLLAKSCPHYELYQITLGEHGILKDIRGKLKEVEFKIENWEQRHHCEFWVTWYNGIICMGLENDTPFLKYAELLECGRRSAIGFIKFQTTYEDNESLEWFLDSTPALTTTPCKKINNGKLKWVSMTENDVLPIDAMIGGFEDEPLYVARAEHNGALCPGKYVKSKKRAFIPWGHREHAKTQFEVLCGYDARWVRCKGNVIPQNVVFAGLSEVRNDPLYIGRAKIDDNLVNGKIHMLYRTCYLAYKGREVERTTYEILVDGNISPRGQTAYSPCFMKDNPNLHPCI